MQYLNQFVINFTGLKLGAHEFNFELDNTFFEHFNYNDFNSCKISTEVILNKKSNFNIYTDLLLYSAARSENINLIKKSYKKKIILIDRFIDSTIAYQHYGMGVDFKIINTINKFLLKNIKVNFTFLNVVNKETRFQRLKHRKD